MTFQSSPPHPSRGPDRHTQQDLRVLLDHAPDAIARFDRALRYVYVNEATARFHQRPAHDFLGKTNSELDDDPETSSAIDHNLRDVFATGHERRFEILFSSPDGLMWFRTRMVPELDESGAVEFVLAISRDLTHQKVTETALHEAETRAAAAQITATLAHEINNPLAVAVNAMYLLSHNSSLDTDARNLVNVVSGSLDRVTNISRRMLFLYQKNQHRDDEFCSEKESACADD